MATVRPFRALRPRPGDAARVAAVPYDVVTTQEAREQAAGNPLSFLRVSRPELELPPGTDPYSDESTNGRSRTSIGCRTAALILEDQPSLYFYRLQQRVHEQIGLAACYSLDEYDNGIIKKHERTRPDKEDDRTRHMLALGAQTGPVFLDLPRGCRRRRDRGAGDRRGAADRLRGIRRSAAHVVDASATATAMLSRRRSPGSRRSTSPTVITAPPARPARRHDIRRRPGSPDA